MGIRRTATLVLGAALGAGGMWALDPEHGPARRRQAAAWAMAQAREGVQVDVANVAGRVLALAERAAEGYQQEARIGREPPVTG